MNVPKVFLVGAELRVRPHNYPLRFKKSVGLSPKYSL